MAKHQLTPVILIDEGAVAKANNGMVIVHAISDGVITRLALHPSMAGALASSLRDAWADAVDQRSETAEIIPFKRRA